MTTSPVLSAEQLVNLLRTTIVALVRQDRVDLSARQFAVFLTCYLDNGPHTVSGLAKELKIAKPAVTRALAHLGKLDYVRRKIDPSDRRSVLVQRTVKGAAFLRETRHIMDNALSAQTIEGSASGRRAVAA